MEKKNLEAEEISQILMKDKARYIQENDEINKSLANYKRKFSRIAEEVTSLPDDSEGEENIPDVRQSTGAARRGNTEDLADDSDDELEIGMEYQDRREAHSVGDSLAARPPLTPLERLPTDPRFPIPPSTQRSREEMERHAKEGRYWVDGVSGSFARVEFSVF